MKKTLLSTLMLLAWFVVFAQSTIENPKIGLSTARMVKILKIELLDTATIMYFQASASPGAIFSIPEQTYIQPAGETEKLFVKSSNGVQLNKWNTLQTSVMKYQLTFPAVPKTTKKLDYGEANGGDWSMYDIVIRPTPDTHSIPYAIAGNWFNSKTGNWEVSFLDSTAIYKCKVWKYASIALKNGNGTVKLTSGTQAVTLAIKTNKNGTCTMGENAANMESYVNDLSKLTEQANPDEKPYELPIFKLDSATYCGYIKGFTPRCGVKTFTVYVDDIITGAQNSFLGRISNDGYFSVKLPLYYPHYVWTNSAIFNGTAFLEPGKTLFQLSDPESAFGSIFMGEPARLNDDLQKLEQVNGRNYYSSRGKVLDMKPADFKTFCYSMYRKDLHDLDSIRQIHAIGTKAYQIKKLDAEYRNFCNIMEYRWTIEALYREKNKIPREQRTLPVKIDSLTAEFYNFITPEIANNPLAVISSSYNSFINRLKYQDILSLSNLSVTTQEIVEELLKSGKQLSEYEKTMFEKMKELENNPEKKAYKEKYEKQMVEFSKKYFDNIQNYYKETKLTDYSGMEKYMTDNAVPLSAEEKQLLKAMDDYSKSDIAQKEKAFSATYKDTLSTIHTTYANAYLSQKRIKVRNEKLEKVLGIKKGFASDIMEAQDACRGIVDEMTPISDNKLKDIQKHMTTPFIADYIANTNLQTKQKIEATRQKGGYAAKEVPKTDADKLFESIMSKYKGKVIYVDFWATWCGPCRSGIEQIKPLKEEMANDNVTFVYITGPTSPKGTWMTMIPDIKGEHYRVSDDEWNYLCTKFSISGIPHYVLVGKTGEVINSNLGHMGNASLKTELMKRINE